MNFDGMDFGSFTEDFSDADISTWTEEILLSSENPSQVEHSHSTPDASPVPSPHATPQTGLASLLAQSVPTQWDLGLPTVSDDATSPAPGPAPSAPGPIRIRRRNVPSAPLVAPSHEELLSLPLPQFRRALTTLPAKEQEELRYARRVMQNRSASERARDKRREERQVLEERAAEASLVRQTTFEMTKELASSMLPPSSDVNRFLAVLSARLGLGAA